MGLLRGGINEIIATTAFNAAPIGIHFRDKRYHAVLFLGSHTEQNVSRDGWLVANIIHDPVLYVKTAFGDLPEDQFTAEPVNGKTMYRLANADGWVAFTATAGHRTAEALTVSLTLEKELVENVAVYPVNRGFNSLIDATVHATRYAITRDPDLKKHIEYHASLVRKCGGKRELEALEMLLGYIG